VIIDAHAHLVPKSWFHPNSPQAIFNIDQVLEQQEKAQVDLTVFGNNWIRTPTDSEPLDIVKEFNEFAAEVTAKQPKHLLGLASSIPFGGDPVLKETERAVRTLGLKGIMVNSSVNGEYLDSPPRYTFFRTGHGARRAPFCPSASGHHRSRKDGDLPATRNGRKTL